jgi:hypothetical protein
MTCTFCHFQPVSARNPVRYPDDPLMQCVFGALCFSPVNAESVVRTLLLHHSFAEAVDLLVGTPDERKVQLMEAGLCDVVRAWVDATYATCDEGDLERMRKALQAVDALPLRYEYLTPMLVAAMMRCIKDTPKYKSLSDFCRCILDKWTAVVTVCPPGSKVSSSPTHTPPLVTS